MCDAMHFAEELTGRFRNDRKPFAAIAISDPSYLSCAANDFGFEKVFSRFVEGMGKKGDVLLAMQRLLRVIQKMSLMPLMLPN